MGNASRLGGESRRAPFHGWMRRIANRGRGRAATRCRAAVTPVVVGCEPNQRTLVRPSVVNGVAVSQVDCVSASELAVSTQTLAVQPSVVPVSYAAGTRHATGRSWRHADHSRVLSGRDRSSHDCAPGPRPAGRLRRPGARREATAIGQEERDHHRFIRGRGRRYRSRGGRQEGRARGGADWRWRRNAVGSAHATQVATRSDIEKRCKSTTGGAVLAPPVFVYNRSTHDEAVTSVDRGDRNAADDLLGSGCARFRSDVNQALERDGVHLRRHGCARRTRVARG